VNDRRIKVTLELELVGDSLSGRVLEPGDEHREFSGWIGLVGVIDALLASGTDGGDSESERE